MPHHDGSGYKTALAALVAAAFSLPLGNAHAQDPPIRHDSPIGQTIVDLETHPSIVLFPPLRGTIIMVAADPSDFVVELDRNGRCGSRYFHIRRSSENFKEVVSLELSAFSLSKPITVFTTGCAGDRNIISHALMHRS